MKLRYIIIPIVIILLLIIGIVAAAFIKAYIDYNKDKAKAYDTTKSYPNALNFKTSSISEINSKNLTGDFNVEAYIIYRIVNHPCPPYMLCEAFAFRPPGILISDSLISRNDYTTLNKEQLKLLDLDTTNPYQFEESKKYKFSIRITEIKSQYPRNDYKYKEIRLLGYDILN